MDVTLMEGRVMLHCATVAPRFVSALVACLAALCVVRWSSVPLNAPCSHLALPPSLRCPPQAPLLL